MKREGRQHGMVRTYPIVPAPLNPRPVSRRLNAPPTAGWFTKVPTKPTNHSKFTSKCGARSMCRGCHFQPANKSKDKVKGAQKLGSSTDVVMTTWRVVDARPGLKLDGFSATSVLDYLTTYDYNE